MCPTVRDVRWADRAAASGPDARPVLRPERRAADPNETAQAVWRRAASSHHTYLPRSPSRVSGCLPSPHVGAGPNQCETPTRLPLLLPLERHRRHRRLRWFGVRAPRPDPQRPRRRPAHAQGGGALGVAHGVGHQLRGQQLGDVDESDQSVDGQDQPEGTATDRDDAEVVGDVEGVLPRFVFGHASTPFGKGEVQEEGRCHCRRRQDGTKRCASGAFRSTGCAARH